MSKEIENPTEGFLGNIAEELGTLSAPVTKSRKRNSTAPPPMISPSSRMNWTITLCSTLTRLELQLRTARELSTNPPTKSAIQSQNLRMTSTKSLMTSGLILLCIKSKRLSVSHANHGSGISPLASLYFQRSCFSQ